MPTNVYISNSLADVLSASTRIAPALSNKYWSDPSSANNVPTGGGKTEIYWIDRAEGIADQNTWVVPSAVIVGGSEVLFQLQLNGTFLSSDVAVQILAGDNGTGWQTRDTQLNFTANDKQNYLLTATYMSGDVYDNVLFNVSASQAMILPQIEHIVVLMMENRSLDNLLGWLYPSGSSPTQVLPVGSSPSFNGLNTSLYNKDSKVNHGEAVYVSNGTTPWNENGRTISEWFVPKPDPGEEFDHVTAQISNNMSGFLSDYATLQSGESAAQIMQAYSVQQLPIISTLAKSFAVSDAWYASVPSQTWPNRGFVQTGSSAGHVNNDNYIPWDITTIFDVLTKSNLSWKVFNNGVLPSLTKAMFLKKYQFNMTNFRGIGEFMAACAQPPTAAANEKLPLFSFVEPNFGVLGNDESYHPPHDVRPGEDFLSSIYEGIQKSPYRDSILFIVLFDEHGGTYDHVLPPGGAQPPAPGAVSSGGFTFDRFGVRIPAIIVSSWVKPGTVFRSNTSVPLDHTSVLATLRDWLGLSNAFARELPSPRIANAPNLAFVLTETAAQSWPTLPTPPARLAAIPEADDSEPLNGVQKSILIAASGLAVGRPLTEAETLDALKRLKSHGDGRIFGSALQPHFPLK